MTKPKFCKDCAYSKPEEKSEWNLRCHNDQVNSKDPWALAHVKTNGTSCIDERSLGFFSFPACGKAGKLHEIY